MLPVVATGALTRPDGAGTSARGGDEGGAADTFGVSVRLMPDTAEGAETSVSGCAGCGGPYVRSHPSTNTPATKLATIAPEGAEVAAPAPAAPEPEPATAEAAEAKERGA